MFLAKHEGLLALLNEESKWIKASDDTLLEKFYKNLKKFPKFHAPRTRAPQFIITHYAAEVRLWLSFLFE